MQTWQTVTNNVPEYPGDHGGHNNEEPADVEMAMTIENFIFDDSGEPSQYSNNTQSHTQFLISHLLQRGR